MFHRRKKKKKRALKKIELIREKEERSMMK